MNDARNITKMFGHHIMISTNKENHAPKCYCQIHEMSLLSFHVTDKRFLLTLLCMSFSQATLKALPLAMSDLPLNTM